MVIRVCAYSCTVGGRSTPQHYCRNPHLLGFGPEGPPTSRTGSSVQLGYDHAREVSIPALRSVIGARPVPQVTLTGRGPALLCQGTCRSRSDYGILTV